MKTKKRKLKIKTSFLYILYILFTTLLLYISFNYNLIYKINNIINISRLIIFIILYELTRSTVKELYKRIIKKMED